MCTSIVENGLDIPTVNTILIDRATFWAWPSSTSSAGGWAGATDAYVYWTNANGTIGRADLDGTGADQAFVTGATGPVGIAVDAKHIYWADSDANTIGRAKLDGSGVEPGFITGAGDPYGVAVDSDHIYWANSVTPGTIGRANLDGSGVKQDFLPTAPNPFGVAVNARHVYWANYDTNAIGRANLDGTGATQTLITSIGTPQGIAVGAGGVYWADYTMTGSAIGLANLDGSNPNTTFIPGLSNPYGLAVDNKYVYWADHDSEAVSRARLDGTEIDPSYIPADSPYGVAVDALPDTVPPRTEITKGAPKKTEKSKVKFKFESSEPGSKFQCKLDKNAWKKCASPETIKNLDKGKHAFQVRAIDEAGNKDGSPAKDKFKVIRKGK